MQLSYFETTCATTPDDSYVLTNRELALLHNNIFSPRSELPSSFDLKGCLAAISSLPTPTSCIQSLVIEHADSWNFEDPSKRKRLSLSTSSFAKSLVSTLRSPDSREVVRVSEKALARYDAFEETFRQKGYYGKLNKPFRKYLIGEGQNSRVYKLDIDEVSYAVKKTKNISPGAGDMVYDLFDFVDFYGGEQNYVAFNTIQNAYLQARSSGIEGTEQLIAYSPQKGTLISSFMPGKQVHKLTSNELSRIPVEHYFRLADTFAEMKNRRIGFDSGENNSYPGNLLYDFGHGFSVIDPSPVEGTHDLMKNYYAVQKFLTAHPSTFYNNYEFVDCEARFNSAMPNLMEMRRYLNSEYGLHFNSYKHLTY